MQFAQETAVVSHIEDGYAFLKASASAGCGSCASKTACGNFSLFNETPDSNLKTANTLGLQEGDSVIVSIPSDKLLLGTLLVYLLPLLSLFLFAILGKIIIGETASIVFGVAGLFLALFAVKKIIAHRSVTRQFEPKLLRKIIQVDAD